MVMTGAPVTIKSILEYALPFGVRTCILPVAAKAGTGPLISVSLTIVKVFVLQLPK